MSATGLATLDFGAYPGSNEATLVITGLTDILPGSKTDAWIIAKATADHTVADHAYAALFVGVTSGSIVEATSFSIYAKASDRMVGTFNVAWAWSDDVAPGGPGGITLDTPLTGFVLGTDGTALSSADSIKEGFQKLQVQSNAISSAIQMDPHSFTETLTNKTWTDGLPIYRKVIDFGALPNATLKSVAHGLTGTFTVVDYYAVAKYATGPQHLRLPHVSSSLATMIMLYVSGTTIDCNSGTTDRSMYATCQVVLEYIKA